MKSDIPLTPEQRVFAAEHHGLVFAFLKENRLDEAEFYDVVIFGYLRSVVRYFTEPALREFTFGTIAWQGMRGELANHRRKQAHRLSDDDIVSLWFLSEEEDEHADLPDKGHDPIMAQMKGDLLLYDLATMVSRQQMNVVRLKSDGYNVRDIARRQKLPMQQIQSLLDEARELLRVLCYE